MHSYRFARLTFTYEDGALQHEHSARVVSLRPQAARLLRYLLEHPGEVIPREQLYSVVWGDQTVVDFESGLAALLRELRQTIRDVDGPGDIIETVPRRGYRLNAEVWQASGNRRRAWRLAMILTVLLPVLVGTGYGLWLTRDASAPEHSIDLGLAILPFEDYENTSDLPEHVGLLMADTLLAELLSRPAEGLQMLGRTSLRPYVGRDDVVSAVGEGLGVELLIEGSVVGRSERGWRVELRLLAVPSGRVVWSTNAEGETGASLDVRAVAATMASDLVRAWPEIRRRVRDGFSRD